MGSFDRKVVVITGAAGGLGKAVAQHFIDQGAGVVGLDVVESDGGYDLLICDLLKSDNCKKAVETILSQKDRIDVLANIAGGFTMGEAVHETSSDTWDFMFGLNAQSVLNMARAVVPIMINQGGGKIINIGARAGLRGAPNMGAYSASKSVVIRLTESLADELKTQGINVNCILPSIIDTPRNREDMPDADFDAWVTPDAIARVVGFLASSDADPIHGAAVPVEGLS